MSNKIPLKIEETNNEVLARIIKATARKYNCSIVIDFSDGNRTVEFVGDEACKPLIVKELNKYLLKNHQKEDYLNKRCIFA